jgi:hypothetical protein
MLKEEDRSFTVKHRNHSYIVAEDDIIDYAEFLDRQKNFKQIPHLCSLCSSDYREQVLTSVDKIRRLPINYTIEKLQKKQLFFNVWEET